MEFRPKMNATHMTSDVTIRLHFAFESKGWWCQPSYLALTSQKPFVPYVLYETKINLTFFVLANSGDTFACCTR